MTFFFFFSLPTYPCIGTIPPEQHKILLVWPKGHNLTKIGNKCISDVVIASVHSEKTRLKNLIMIIIIIIIISMNKSQELTVFHGRQKLISAMN